MGFQGGFIRPSVAPLFAPSLVCAWSGLRLARVVALAAAALLCVAFPQAASASLSWSGPITIDPGGGGGYGQYTLLSGVACPSTVQCTAVDARGQELTFDPDSPGTPTPITVSGSYPAGENLMGGYNYPAGNYGLEAVACPSTGQCTAVEYDSLDPPYVGRQVTFDPETGVVITAPTTIDNGGGTMKAVACPSTSQCTAVDYAGNEVTFDPTSPGTPTKATIGTAILQGVACPSTSQCTAVYATGNGGGSEVTFDPNSPGNQTRVAIDTSTFIEAVACPSTSQCTAVDYLGNAVTFDPASPGTPATTSVDAETGLDAVACPSTSQCTAVNNAGYQVTFDPVAPGTPTRTVLDKNACNEYCSEDLTAVACPSVALCVVVGRGEVFVGQESVVAPPANSSPPVISGTVKVGQTLSTSTGTWSGTAPISYRYQWARCSSSCSAISGAAASTYTLTSGDVGQKISVVVTATNTAGSAQAGAAEVGPVVAAPSGPSSAEVKAALSKLLKPSGKTATTKAIIKSGGFSFSFSVPSAGKLVIDWYYLPSGAKLAKKAKHKPVLVGAGQRTFSAAGTAMIKIKLTAAGRSLLKHATQVKLTAKGTFTPTGKAAITATRTFVLKR
jgi:hypothetical protein